MSELQRTANPESRLILTVDFDGEFSGLQHLAKDFNHKVHAVKLGQGFLLHKKAHAIHQHLRVNGAVTYLDAKYREDADQMSYVIEKTSEIGFRYVSVAPSAGAGALKAAGVKQPNVNIVSSLSSGDKDLNKIEMRNIQSANSDLDKQQRLCIVMCNVADIENVKGTDDFTVIATGIRMPGDESHDQLETASPSEALRRGADYLAVGRAVTAFVGPQARAVAFDRILADISQVM